MPGFFAFISLLSKGIVMRTVVFLSGFLITLVVGCGGYTPEAGVNVTGKIVKGGQPLIAPSVESGGGLQIQLCPLTARPDGSPGDAAGGEYSSDGTVKFQYAGRGVSPGKYRLAVEMNDGTNDQDVFQGKYSLQQSKIEITVPENKVGGRYDFGTIDLDSPPAGTP
jgi:hypothetical protein